MIRLLIILIVLQNFNSRCINVGGISATFTTSGIYCKFYENNTPNYAPLEMLENYIPANIIPFVERDI